MRKRFFGILVLSLFSLSLECVPQEVSKVNEAEPMAEVKTFCPDERPCEESDYVGLWRSDNGTVEEEFLEGGVYHRYTMQSGTWVIQNSQTGTWSFVPKDQSIKILSGNLSAQTYKMKDKELIHKWNAGRHTFSTGRDFYKVL